MLVSNPMHVKLYYSSSHFDNRDDTVKEIVHMDFEIRNNAVCIIEKGPFQ